jgi:chorismate dehydratase
MIRLGHIDYSNCLPVHAALLERSGAAVQIVRGVPSALNAELAAGRIDVAPCSSIEFARHAGEYRVLPELVIGSDGPVGSILLESSLPLEALDGRVVLLPTASATSVVLLRALLEIRVGVTPRYVWFDQNGGAPAATGAAAALWIGDAALRRRFAPGRAVHDLGAEWAAWRALPFAFAIWQTRLGPEHDAELRALHRALVDSRDAFLRALPDRAARHAPEFGIAANVLHRYWGSLHYGLTPRMSAGLEEFYRLAARLGEVPGVPRLRFTPAG